MDSAFDVIVVAGGEGRRLGGLDKGALVVAGTTLLDGVLRATAGARTTVVVGDPRPTVREVFWTREQPPGGGPLAALVAGMAALPAAGDTPREVVAGEDLRDSSSEGRAVVVLAVDLPFLTRDHVGALLAALAGSASADVAASVDAAGRRQLLTAAYRRGPLAQALGRVAERRAVDGAPVRLLFDLLAVVTVPGGDATRDCDTPQELEHARAALDTPGRL